MLSILDLLFLSAALAMDCFTVSILSGVILRRPMSIPILRMAILFGLFQGLMPLLGWLGIAFFSSYLEAVDHWIAFGLLAFIGGKMVWESFSSDNDEHQSFNPLSLHTQLLLAVATSIDALAVGISLSCMGYRNYLQLSVPILMIGLVSLLFSLVGYSLGVRFGRTIAKRLKPELLGGLVLIFIGVKVLLSHLLA
jgi:putative Mn2+ efflux pump MntP